MSPPDGLRPHLQKLLDSQALGGSDQLKRLLEVIVDRTAKGETVKEYTLGVEAFGRPANYDPKVDPIVRVQARRLRAKLDEYYATEGAADPIRITLPKGGYVPVFEPHATAVAPARSRRTLVLAIGAVLVASGVAGLAMRQTRHANDQRSMAVLPLRNIAHSSSAQAIADEATEALVTSLARIDTLQVASATTTRKVAATKDSLPELAKALQVRWIVEGAVGAEEDGRILLKLRVVDATSDRKIWADTFTSPHGELSVTQKRTASAIAVAIERFLAQPPRSTP